MRIVVTGATGFTGTALCTALQQHGSYEVHGTQGIDLRDAPAVQALFAQLRPQAVVHLAARSFVNDTDIVGFYDHNVVATSHVLDAARDHGAERVIVASSANVYGVPPSAAALTESAPLAPINHYGASKLAAEHIAHTYNDDFALSITRCFNYTGIGQAAHFLVPKLVAHFAERKAHIDLGNLAVARDYTALDDVVAAYIALLGAEPQQVAGKTVNICSNHTYSLHELLALLTEISGHQLEVRSQPHFVRRHDIAILRGDYSKLHHLTGWQPQQSIPDLLTQMLHTAQR